MIIRALFGRSALAVVVLVVVSGCAQTVSNTTAAALDCNENYTRCAPLVERNSVDTSSFKETSLDTPASTNTKNAGQEAATAVASDAMKNKLTPPVIMPVLFGFDQATTNQLELEAVVRFLLTYPKVTLTLHGYTDPIGRQDYNQTLSYQRAKSVHDRLVLAGVAVQQVSITAHGENNLVVSEASGEKVSSRADLIEYYAPNRRVVLEFNLPDTSSSSHSL
ncbi:OmpA family protein [Marinomonas hwangdonensis]|uniref:OmpA family protein n=1 Tax=Marinomonas hwangdonensis TaxID=1053647 RepID=A0A3M8QAL1_9GAMM|nr:OmpA family protein [Marinomonas hwangdonensis]RNF53079.1 OmpA family protein [Marinomonas hwangdonensis]